MSQRAKPANVLRALQGGIESLYRVTTELDVNDYLVDTDTQTSSREQLLAIKYGPRQRALEIGLFVDQRALANLAARDPRERLDDDNLQDFLYAVEGVSHFVYVVHRAQTERPVSAVELELQAEVDKYVIALLLWWNQTGEPPENLRRRLFSKVRFLPDLSSEERDRYRLANDAADGYAQSLENRFVKKRALDGLWAEIRRFYRKGLAEKLDEITQRAA